MFNIYYINYAKAYEIAMLQNNELKTSETKEKVSDIKLNGKGEIDTKGLKKIPLIGNAIPEFSFDASTEGDKSCKIIDTINVVNTKSVILKKIYNSAKEMKDLKQCKVGQIVKLNNISLNTINEKEILAIKAMQSGIFNKIAVDGMGDVNMTSLFDVLIKGSSYIFNGKSEDDKENIIIKIPMQTENELESQYSISDLEIGRISIIGIYKGKYKYSEIYEKLNKLSSYKTDEPQNDIEYETDDDSTDKKINSSKEYHYIDIIAIVQDIQFK